MTIRLGDTAPDFTAQTTHGEINFHEWLGGDWAMLFSHPKNFTPVCTTELGAAARMKPEFDKRGCKLIGLSVDSIDSHPGWLADIEETQGAAVDFPLIADSDRAVSSAYDMLDQDSEGSMTVRSVFIIGPDAKVKLMLTYPASTGRDFGELLRVLDSVQLTANRKLATPANWRNGEDCVVLPSVTDEEANDLFPEGIRVVKSYLRMTACPAD